MNAFNPNHRHQQAVARAMAASNAWDDMATHALHGGPAYEEARDRFWKLNGGRS